MIDVESQIFNAISKPIREKYSGIFITGEYVRIPSSFPCISIIETENEVYRNGRSNCEIENFATLYYEAQIFSNKTKGKKSECKELAAMVDEGFRNLGFTRTMLSPVPNYEDASIYRMVARYRANVSKDEVIYRR